VHFITLHAARKRYSLLSWRGFCISRKGGTEGSGWGHPQGDMHMVATRLGCEKTMVVTRLGQFSPWLHGQT